MKWIFGILAAVCVMFIGLDMADAGKEVSKSRSTYSWTYTPEQTITTSVPADVSSEVPLPVYTSGTGDVIAMETRIQATSWRTVPYGRTTRTRIPATYTRTTPVTQHRR